MDACLFEGCGGEGVSAVQAHAQLDRLALPRALPTPMRALRRRLERPLLVPDWSKKVVGQPLGVGGLQPHELAPEGGVVPSTHGVALAQLAHVALREPEQRQHRVLHAPGVLSPLDHALLQVADGLMDGAGLRLVCIVVEVVEAAAERARLAIEAGHHLAKHAESLGPQLLTQLAQARQQLAQPATRGVARLHFARTDAGLARLAIGNGGRTSPSVGRRVGRRAGRRAGRPRAGRRLVQPEAEREHKRRLVANVSADGEPDPSLQAAVLVRAAIEELGRALGGARQQEALLGDDLVLRLRLELEQALHGAPLLLELSRRLAFEDRLCLRLRVVDLAHVAIAVQVDARRGLEGVDADELGGGRLSLELVCCCHPLVPSGGRSCNETALKLSDETA